MARFLVNLLLLQLSWKQMTDFVNQAEIVSLSVTDSGTLFRMMKTLKRHLTKIMMKMIIYLKLNQKLSEILFV